MACQKNFQGGVEQGFGPEHDLIVRGRAQPERRGRRRRGERAPARAPQAQAVSVIRSVLERLGPCLTAISACAVSTRRLPGLTWARWMVSLNGALERWLRLIVMLCPSTLKLTS